MKSDKLARMVSEGVQGVKNTVGYVRNKYQNIKKNIEINVMTQLKYLDDSIKIPVSLYLNDLSNKDLDELKISIESKIKYSVEGEGLQSNLKLILKNIDQSIARDLLRKYDTLSLENPSRRVDLVFENLNKKQSIQVTYLNVDFIRNAVFIVKNLHKKDALELLEYAKEKIKIEKFCRPKLEPFDKYVLPNLNKQEILDFKINETY